MKSNKTIAIIDYGLGNLYSLEKAVRLFSSNVIITSDPKVIASAGAIILPGVGAFAKGMEGLKERNLIESVKSFAKSDKPMLGICLGAQLLFSRSFEFGEHQGLDLIKGNIDIFPEAVRKTNKIPHIGWNSIFQPKEVDWNDTILTKMNNKTDVYFVHSYIMIPDNQLDILALAEYGDLEFCAVTKHENIYGTQFHPEKSGEIGLTIIKNFISLTD